MKAPASNASESQPSRSSASAGSRIDRLVPLALVFLLFLLGFPSLGNYSVTWDEALGDFFFGERYLSFFTSLDPRYLDFEKNPFPADRSPDLFVSPFKTRPWEYYPFANTLAAASSEILSRRLRLLDPFDGFHAVNLFLGAALILVLHTFARPRFGRAAALAAILLLFLSPRVVCDLMANIKDFPTMVLYSITVVAAFAAIERGSVRGVLGAGALWGLALATKANALFLPAIPLAVLALGGAPDAWRGRRRALALALAAAAALGFAVLVASWPYLWADPIDRLVTHFRYIAHQKFQTRAESVAPPLEALLFTTPLPFLALFVAGLVPIARRARARDRAALLPLAWIAVVVARLHIPGAVNFDGVRHFLELFPALAVVAAMGVAWLIEQAGRLQSGPARVALRAAVLCVPLTSMAWSLVRSHPFEIAYWNALIGGLAGAQDQRMAQSCDYFGTSYRLGLDWLNENALPGSALAVPLMEHTVRLVAPERLRADVELLPVAAPLSQTRVRGLARIREAAERRDVYVMFVPRDDWINPVMSHFLRNERPIETWDLDGVPVLLMYRLSPPPGPAAAERPDE